MQHSTRTRLYRAASLTVLVATAAIVAGCAAKPTQTAGKKRPKEYFAESEYGVKASPRVTTAMSNLPRGGGRDQTGKPYKVRGKWYYPKEDKSYASLGAASWYGDAFHGRLTANGEIYDMTHLTAAHPTMPLPSYARVTNTKNGSSVIVRVNDRGPYSHGRVIDLSKRAAEMLDYAHSGTAAVKVEYVGRAPLDGQDDRYLLASYRPGKGMGDPSNIGLPAGVMIAMNGPTPSADVAPAPSFPGTLSDAAATAPVIAMQANAPTSTLGAQAAQFGQPAMAAQGVSGGDVILPEFGPIAPQRPDGLTPTNMALATMSYASNDGSSAGRAFDALSRKSMSSDDIVNSWKRLNPGPRAMESALEAYISAGTFSDGAEAQRVAKALSAYGRTAVEQAEFEGKTWYSVDLYSDGRNSLDIMLKAAWSHGAPDAFAVHD
ncbi:septal ring lytic transglycosylase RlpA family protein [Aminobacter sp. HY435]|uniref:septal ring lytic transglycosylase RlpA family protein n=1 Tax=Aminobacter sp. HY435 TaxID=2970917 RepID=UPI0022B98148|nr:septal ring lytic transglycosylase RlpA family protein [Aminobacter sp. HY435]